MKQIIMDLLSDNKLTKPNDALNVWFSQKRRRKKKKDKEMILVCNKITQRNEFVWTLYILKIWKKILMSTPFSSGCIWNEYTLTLKQYQVDAHWVVLDLHGNSSRPYGSNDADPVGGWKKWVLIMNKIQSMGQPVA